MPRRRNKGRSGVVRSERLDRTLDAMNYEMAGKTAESMAKYHTMKVAPLEARVRTIELVLGIAFLRWCYWKVADAWHWIYMKFTEPVPESEEGEDPKPDSPPGLLEPLADPVEDEIKKTVRKAYPH